MKLLNFIYNTTESIYSTIDEMPIYNWVQIQTTGDLKYLYKSCKGKVNNDLFDFWEALQDEYINRFGLDESYRKQLKLMIKVSKLNCQFVLTKDRFLLNEINMVEHEIEMSNKIEGLSFYDIKDHAEKHKGFRIDPKVVTVTEWYTTLKNMSNGKAN